jgi:DNA replication protein DnaC
MKAMIRTAASTEKPPRSATTAAARPRWRSAWRVLLVTTAVPDLEQLKADLAPRPERHRLEAQLLPGKLLSTFDFTAVPSVSKAHVTALIEGDGWIEQGANLLLFGPPGVGKSHLVCAIGNGLIDRGYRVHFS